VSKFKTAIVVMAQNPDHYISEFIEHHKMFVDKIFLIDHRSQKKLSNLRDEKIIHIESPQVAQFQSETTNAVIRDFRIYQNFDWIFVLDVDEFLPFASKVEFTAFIETRKNSQVVAFNWYNGVGIFPSEKSPRTDDKRTLIDVSPLLVSSKPNPTIKVAVNCRKTKYPFYFQTGAHRVVQYREFISVLLGRSIYKPLTPAREHHHLFHILSFDRHSFYKKIKNYVQQMDMRKHVRGQGGWMVKGYLAEFDDAAWLEVIQNFRVSDKSQAIPNVTEEMFERVDIFKHLNAEDIAARTRQIGTVNNTEAKEPETSETTYLANKKFDSDIATNIKYFKILCSGSRNITVISDA
jgi:hypothetical protein